MKKIFAFVLIFCIFLLSSCSFLKNDEDEKGNNNINSGENSDSASGNEGKLGSEGNSSDETQEENKEDDKSPDENNSNEGENPPENENGNENKPSDEENNPTNEPSEQHTLSDYIEYLIETEYCADADFLRFVANLDGRAEGRAVYVSNTGEGDGSFNDPMSLEDALDTAKPGDTIYLRGGEYVFKEAIWLSISGTKDSYITIKSYPTEQAVLTTTPENISKYHENGEYIFFGLDGDCSYLIFEDLDICSATDEYTAAFACYDGGQNHIIFNNITVHDLHTTTTKGGSNAFLFIGESRKSINNIVLLNNRCYNMTLGYSEAISFAGNCEYCYVIGNEVFDNTNIGIDFYGNARYCSVEALDQARFCVASYNRVYNCNSVYADCGGIYVDGGRNCLIEGNFVSNCQYGIEIGSEELNESYPVTDIIVRNNILSGNTVCAMRVGGYDTKTSGTVKNCLVYNNTFVGNGGGYDVIISKADGIIFANNIFAGENRAVETEFPESYIKNLRFFSNCFIGEGELSIYESTLSPSQLNGDFGDGNFSSDVPLGEDFGIDVGKTANSDYLPKYDFYLTVREEDKIGAVN